MTGEDMPQTHRRSCTRCRRILIGTAAVPFFGIAGLLALALLVQGPKRQQPPVVHHSPPPPTDAGPLRVLTLNVAHGRSQAAHQLFVSSQDLRKNLSAIAVLLDREQAHVVALQEADGPSVWSGRFDHVAYLATEAGYAQSVRGSHVDGAGLDYGTALLSQLPLSDPLSLTFEPTPPSFTKGFIRARVPFPGRPDVQVEVLSVHLDFVRAGARRDQVRAIARELGDREGPLVVMGDFNCGWVDAEENLRWLVEELELTPYLPEADPAELVTFPSTDARLDWILISPELKFEGHAILTDEVSDHRAVLAELSLRSAE